MTRETVRVGCASAFWGDSTAGAEQLVRHGNIDFLVFDYLAEITMSLLARARARKPELGYVPDFVEAIAPLLPEIKQKGIRIVSNAGGINPQAAATALRRKAAAAACGLMPPALETRRMPFCLISGRSGATASTKSGT